jgi:hypothetical protein
MARSIGYSSGIDSVYEMRKNHRMLLGQMRSKGPQGAVVQLGMTVIASHGAALVRIRQQRLSKRAQKFRRLLGLRCHNASQINVRKI